MRGEAWAESGSDRWRAVSIVDNQSLAGDLTSIRLEAFPTPHPGHEPAHLTLQRSPPPLVSGLDMNAVERYAGLEVERTAAGTKKVEKGR